jgi:hypothetical protein
MSDLTAATEPRRTAVQGRRLQLRLGGWCKGATLLFRAAMDLHTS